MTLHWNADKYAQDFHFVPQYGLELIQFIDKVPNMTVLDLGCGNGVLTKKIAEQGIHVMGLDASSDFLKQAVTNYPEISFLNADATNFELPEKADAVFSNAVLHWIPQDKQIDMMKCVYHSLNTGGQFVFELGGNGNNSLIHQALKETFEENGYEYHMPFYFPTIGTYSSLLEQVGFKVVYAVLFDRPTVLKGENGMYDWLQMFIKSPFQDINIADKEKICLQTVEKLRDSLYHNDVWYADYVRLRCKAKKV